MQRLLIAESSEMMLLALHDALSGEFEIRTCCDGNEALELLDSFRPDAMILDLHLPFRDGFTLLRQAAWRPPVTIGHTIQSSSGSAYTIAERMHLSRVLSMPKIGGIVSALMEELCTASCRQTTYEKVTMLLHDLGFRSSLDGYRLLAEGLVLFAQDPTQSLSDELYPEIARRLNVASTQAVEFCIRKSIADAWERQNDSIWRRYFPYDNNGDVPRPTIRMFLRQIARELSREEAMCL